MTKEVIQRRQQRRKANRVKNNIIFAVTAILFLGGIYGVLYNKTHKVRECRIVTVVDNTVTVQHPNTLFYQITNEDYNKFKNQDTVKVSFNELRDWNSQFEINEIID